MGALATVTLNIFFSLHGGVSGNDEISFDDADVREAVLRSEPNKC
jgi:hypothetical protein